MIIFLIGLFLGYCLYPLNMTYKLFKLKRKLVKLEIEHMRIMNDLKNITWNEDNL